MFKHSLPTGTITNVWRTVRRTCWYRGFYLQGLRNQATIFTFLNKSLVFCQPSNDCYHSIFYTQFKFSQGLPHGVLSGLECAQVKLNTFFSYMKWFWYIEKKEIQWFCQRENEPLSVFGNFSKKQEILKNLQRPIVFAHTSPFPKENKNFSSSWFPVTWTICTSSM